MVLRFLKKLLLLFAVLTIGLALYAEITNDTELRWTGLSILSVLVAAAYALGMFRRKPAVTKPVPMPAPRAPRKDPSEHPPDPPSPAKTLTENPTNEDAGQLGDDELYIVFSRLAGIKTGDAFRKGVNDIIVRNGLAPLTPQDVDRLAAEVDRRDLRGKAFRRTPGIALVRMQRAELDVEYGGTSWLGGLPTLGDTPWPWDEFGRAMHHLAQIDLGTVPDPLLPKGMPTSGALTFFLTTSSDGPHRAKVVYLPEIGNTATEPPSDLVPIYDGPDWGHYVKGYARENAPDTFPRWPVEFVLLPMTDRNKDDDARELMADLMPQQASGDLSPANYRQSLPDFARPWFWDTAHRFTMSIRLARDDIRDTIRKAEQRVREFGAGYQGAVNTLRQSEAAFSQYVDEVSIWAVSNGPWEKMTLSDAQQLEEYFAQVREVDGKEARFKPFYQFTQGELLSLQEAATATLVAAANAEPEVYAMLPFEVRDDIDTEYRIASKGRWHQMFGLGSRMKSAVSDHTHHHLLLQLHSDQLVNWMWGDKGVVQFWIAEDDLLAQNWDAVEMTLEGH